MKRDASAAEPTWASLYREALRLLRPYGPLAALSALMGVMSGLATAALLAQLNRAIAAAHTELAGLLGAFAGLCALVLVSETVSAVGNSSVGQRVVADLRREIVRRITTAPIAAIQQLKAPRLLATLSHDVDTISMFTFNLSGFLVSLAITLGCFAYLALLSGWLFLAVALAIGIGMWVNYRTGITWFSSYERVRDAQDELQKGYEAITSGAKELRMNRRRRARTFERRLERPIERIRDHKIIAMRAFWAGRALAGFMFFGVLGVIVWLGARFGISREVVSGFALVLLYVKGPLEQVLIELPALGQARVAFRRVAEMSARLSNPEPHLTVDATPPVEPWAPAAIALEQVSYRFGERDEAAPFTLGPIDLTIRPGETLFITGENGCGKTTLLMLLLGLYEPTSGEITLGGVPVAAARRDAYRQLFSTVFFDYVLFAELICDGAGLLDARNYLAQLDLAHKVSVVDGDEPAFSTIELSAGQRKRLALIQAYLEDRPIMVFDEWAAEQDPAFRRIFYTEILPDLKRQGRTLIVISHDDRYFDAADRCIRLHAGQIVEDRAPRRSDQSAVSAVESL